MKYKNYKLLRIKQWILSIVMRCFNIYPYKIEHEGDGMYEHDADKYVIIDLRNMGYMKNEDGKINYYDTEQEAGLVCGMYEFENAWICKLIFNHVE